MIRSSVKTKRRNFESGLRNNGYIHSFQRESERQPAYSIPVVNLSFFIKAAAHYGHYVFKPNNATLGFNVNTMRLFSSLLGNSGVVQPEELAKEYANLLAEGETIEIGFKLIRDVFVFTNKRLVLVDKQGLTGKKIEYLSIVYKSISKFSIETAGHFDLDAELKIWISSEVNPSVIKRFNNQVNIYDLQKVLAKYVLN